MPPPVRGFRITTPYGRRNRRLWPWRGYHTGDDYACPTGTVVRATRAGRVDIVTYAGSFGRYVRVNHGSGITSYYCHLSRTSVRVGQRVSAGTVLGRSGATGNVTGPHVHYEERRRGIPRRPVYNKTSAPPRGYQPPAFPKGLRPGRKKPSAVRLQRALKRAGYMPSSVRENVNYGPRTQNAVARFHNANPQFKSRDRRGRRLKRDVRIGPKGWAFLFRRAYG
jgi:hypothetical protein